MRRGATGGTITALVTAVAVLVISATWAFGGGLSAPTSTVGPADRGWTRAGSDDHVGRSGSRAGSSAALPGVVVDVAAIDMDAIMGGQGMMGAWSGSTRTGGRMVLSAERTSVPAGMLTVRLLNDGGLDHELVVLPLADGQQIGQRTVGPDGTVDESSSLGEASVSNAEGEGDGIAPGRSGWVTLDLAPGRYELICNIEGHYAAGMSTLLVVH